jgi:hypothetical protein
MRKFHPLGSAFCSYVKYLKAWTQCRYFGRGACIDFARWQNASKIQVEFRILRAKNIVGKRDFIPSREVGLIKIPWRYAGK